MKKILSILVLAMGVILFLGACSSLESDNPKGKTMYYTKITKSGDENENDRYDYEQTAYDKKGKEKDLKFSTDKQLEKGAYIQLYYQTFFGVRYWEEVDYKEIPDEVQEKYPEK